MADVTVDNGALTDFAVDTKALGSGEHVQRIELVTAVESNNSTDLAKQEDAVHQSGDFGFQLLAVRKDTAVALAGADGDYIPLIVDDEGKLHVNIGEAPAAGRGADSMSVAQTSDVIMNDLTPLTPARAVIAASGSGDNTLVAAQGVGNAIRVHQLFIVAASAVGVRFESGAGGTALTGVVQLAANTGFVLPFSPIPWIVTADNALLNLELSGAVPVAGALVYTVT